MIHSKDFSRGPRGRAGFTLIELLITISIMAMMAGMVLFALSSAQETAKEAKTKAIIAKLDSIIKAKWDSYKTRRVPITIPPGTAPTVAAKMRLDGLRDLMRMEMPDRWSDVTDAPVAPFGGTLIARPSVSQGYLRRYTAINTANAANPTVQHQYAECLYLTVSALATENDIDINSIGPIADTDNDGIPEFLDGWGTPIRWLRWAPGFQSEFQTLVTGTIASPDSPSQTITITATGANFSQSAGAYVGGTIAVLDLTKKTVLPNRMARITGYAYSNPTATFTCSTAGVVSVNDVNTVPPYRGTTKQEPFGGLPPSSGDTFVVMAPDPFDPTGVYPMYASGSATAPNPDTSLASFSLLPVIFSGGPNKAFGTVCDTTSAIHYAAFGLSAFAVTATGDMMGAAIDIPAEPNFVSSAWLDNIHNHMLNVK